jgi:hypothetical protein
LGIGFRPAPTERLTILLCVLRQALLHDFCGSAESQGYIEGTALLVWIPAIKVGLAFIVILARLIGGKHRFAGREERLVRGLTAILLVATVPMLRAASCVLATDAYPFAISVYLAVHCIALGAAVAIATSKQFAIQGQVFTAEG